MSRAEPLPMKNLSQAKKPCPLALGTVKGRVSRDRIQR